jgi:hypothetical protein
MRCLLRMRPLHCIASFAPLLFACGVGLSESSHGSPNPTPGPKDAGADAGCSGGIPLILCAGPCGGEGTGPQCIDGTWQCPVFNGPACPIDVDAGCAGTAPVCPQDCAGEGTQAVCFEGEWSCFGTACADAGAPDAATDDADAAPLFACGDLACDPTASYCEIVAGGPVLADGGTPTTYSCNPLPAACVGEATCGCIEGVQGAGCGCVASDGRVIETCEAP